MTPLFPPMPAPMVPIAGTDLGFPVRRIFCVGRNYEKHAKEMGGDVDREAPWYFTKSPAHACLSGAVVSFPQGTSNYHHEMELAVYLGDGAQVLGHSCALDMTRRDRQQDGKDHRRPWSLGKDVENAAVLAPIARDFTVAGQRIWLDVNGETRQDATLEELVWSVPEVIAHLSGFYRLGAGDVILTGTPAGVGPVQPGDVITGGVDGLEPISLTLTPTLTGTQSPE